MSHLTFKPAAKVQGPGFNKYGAQDVVNKPTQAVYQQVGHRTSGSLTSDLDADVSGKFLIALSAFHVTPAQVQALHLMKDAFLDTEDAVRPDQLSSFKIRQAADGEVCIYRMAADGIVNLILDDDGEWAYSFSAFKGSQRPNELTFHGSISLPQAKELTYIFFPG